MFVTSTKEVMFSSFVVCLLATLHKNFQTDLHESFGEGLQWADEQLIKFWWRSDQHLDTRIVSRIRQYWEIWKVVSTDCTA